MSSTEHENFSESLKEPKPDSQISPGESLDQLEDSNTRTVHGVRWVLVCASLYFASLIYGLDSTIAADIQAAIVERFDSVERLTWVGTAFALGSVCSILPVLDAASLQRNNEADNSWKGCFVF
jgi:hypothetical protein